MTNLDPRRHAFREDLAAKNLRGLVEARRYVSGERRQVAESALPLRRAPRFDAPLDTEVLHGETLTVYDESEGWAWVQLDHDGYVGYVPNAELVPPRAPATHRIATLRTYVFPEPDAKAPPLALLSLNALVRLAEEGGRYARLDTGGYVYASHIVPADHRVPDFVAVAEGFLGAPYLWGGRSSLGLDCSALVQMALAACAIACPRDSDMQQNELGEPVDPGRLDEVARGDLIFWRGHVAIAAGAGMLVHANAHHMMVVREPQDAAVARIAAAGLEVRAIRRLFRS